MTKAKKAKLATLLAVTLISILALIPASASAYPSSEADMSSEDATEYGMTSFTYHTMAYNGEDTVIQSKTRFDDISLINDLQEGTDGKHVPTFEYINQHIDYQPYFDIYRFYKFYVVPDSIDEAWDIHAYFIHEDETNVDGVKEAIDSWIEFEAMDYYGVYESDGTTYQPASFEHIEAGYGEGVRPPYALNEAPVYEDDPDWEEKAIKWNEENFGDSSNIITADDPRFAEYVDKAANLSDDEKIQAKDELELGNSKSTTDNKKEVKIDPIAIGIIIAIAVIGLAMFLFNYFKKPENSDE